MSRDGKRHIVRNILLVVLAIVVLFIVSFSFSFNFAGKTEDKNCNYEYVMKDVFADKDPRVVDIAMLGAHDAFSSEINFSKKVDANESGIITNGAVNFFAKGFLCRMLRAQSASAMQLLKSGVRYLDVRVTEVDGDYYTCHGLISNELKYYLQDVVDFLQDHKGELVVFDIQHFHSGPNESDKDGFDKLFKYIKTIKNAEGKSLFDYVYYVKSGSQIPISELKYSVSTNAKTSSGVIVLAKTFWNNTNDFKALQKGIMEEVQFVKENGINNVFVVNQAQLTGFVNSAKLLNSIPQWSLLDMAAKSNAKLVADKEEFIDNLSALKIFMVDNATSQKGNFNKLANEYIMEYNSNLK